MSVFHLQVCLFVFISVHQSVFSSVTASICIVPIFIFSQLPTGQSIHLLICLSVHLPFLPLVCPTVHLFNCPQVCLYICSCASLSVFTSAHLPFCLSLHLFICLTVCLFFFSLSACMSLSLSLSVSLSLSIYLSISQNKPSLKVR
jgi:hypothetical protein